MAKQENDKNVGIRPFGCFFDAYGFDEKYIPDLNCDNCPISGMNCEYKGYATAAKLARIVSLQKNIVIVSKL